MVACSLFRKNLKVFVINSLFPVQLVIKYHTETVNFLLIFSW